MNLGDNFQRFSRYIDIGYLSYLLYRFSRKSILTQQNIFKVCGKHFNSLCPWSFFCEKDASWEHVNTGRFNAFYMCTKERKQNAKISQHLPLIRSTACQRIMLHLRKKKIMKNLAECALYCCLVCLFNLFLEFQNHNLGEFR